MKGMKKIHSGKNRGEKVARKERNRKNKMFVVRKRQIAALSLILLIGVAGYLNFQLNRTETDPGVSVMYTEAAKRLGEAKMVNSTEENQKENTGEKNNTETVAPGYFEQARTEREKKRGESVEMLTGIINSTEADKEAKENATAQIAKLSAFTERETAAENMIRAKGYGDCVVFMGENVTSVAVETNGLNEIDAAVITDIVAEGGIVKAEQVKIVEIKPNS